MTNVRAHERAGSRPQFVGRSDRIRRFAFICLFTQLAYVAYALSFFESQGYLPPPFYFVVRDTFMDFFNVNSWAWMPGIYDQWRAIYTLPVFALAQQLSSLECISPNSLLVRSCDLSTIWYLFFFYLVASFFCAAVFLRELGSLGYRRYVTWLLWFVVILTCMPGLFGLERGNYIVLAFMALSFLALGGYCLFTAFCLAFAILIKQYLVVLLVVPLLKRRFDFVAQCSVFLIAISLWAYMVFPDPHWSMSIENMFSFASSAQFSIFDKLWYPTSFEAWVRVGTQALATATSTGALADIAAAVIAAASLLTKILILTTILVMSWRHRILSSNYMFFVMLLALLIMSDSLSGYAMLLMLPFFPALLRQGCSPWQMCWVLIAFLPLDAIQQPFGPHFEATGMSFLSGEEVFVKVGLQIGAILRPVALFSLMVTVLLQMLSAKGHVPCRAEPCNNQAMVHCA